MAKISNSTCLTCKHWGMHRFDWPHDRSPEEMLHLCLRYPPVPVVIDNRQMDVQPRTHKNNFCGEHQFIKD